MISRRRFLADSARVTAGLAASNAIGLTPEILGAPFTANGELKALANIALNAARKLGASYADIRINRYRSQNVSVRSSPDRSGKVNTIPSAVDNENFGFGVRVIANGAWGFASSHLVEKDEIARITANAVAVAKANSATRKTPVRLAPVPAYADVTWKTRLVKDPFDVPIKEKLDFLMALAEAVRKTPKVFSVNGQLSFRSEQKYFASSVGSYIEQYIVHTIPSCTAQARDVQKGIARSRNYSPQGFGGGYEFVLTSGMLENARRVGEEVLEHLAAPPVEPGAKDLVLMPNHLGLTIHESIGHPTELDRALGYEANYAGTSFIAPPEKVMGKMKVGSEILNFIGDRTKVGTMAACGWDDDGVKTQTWHIIKGGIFQTYQTTRDQAHLIGEKESRGCCQADSFDSVPFQRMPNVMLEAGTKPQSLDDLIAGVDDGILIDGRGSYSIDQQRYNFQFGGDAFWE
ncbi:MAG TPA: TldD/PmbA family protein, partial [Blastocatellia bacterium]|nr:TldD/PmbA family protein [Blastocatellia bacterium]